MGLGEEVFLKGHSKEASPVAQTVKNLPAMPETQVQPLDQENPLEKGMATVFLPGEFHGQRSLAGYSPWVTNNQTRLSN